MVFLNQKVNLPELNHSKNVKRKKKKINKLKKKKRNKHFILIVFVELISQTQQ